MRGNIKIIQGLSQPGMVQLAPGHGQVIERQDRQGLVIPGPDRAGVAFGFDGIIVQVLAALLAVYAGVVEPEADGPEDFFFVSASRSWLKRSISRVT